MRIKTRRQISMKALTIIGILFFMLLTEVDALSHENSDAATREPNVIEIAIPSSEVSSREDVVVVHQLTSSDDLSNFADDDTVNSSSDSVITKTAQESNEVSHWDE